MRRKEEEGARGYRVGWRRETEENNTHLSTQCDCALLITS